MVEPIFLRVPQEQPYQPVAPALGALSETAIGILGAYQKQQQQLAEQERLRQQQMQFQQDMRTYTQDPSATNYAMILTRYPQLKDQMAKAHEAMNEQQRQAKLSYLQPAYAAFVSGDIPTATLGLAERRTALQNAGKTQEALAVDNLIKAMDENPNAARVQFHMQMSSLLGPDKAADTFKMFEMMPAEMRKSEAMARSEAEKAEQEKMATNMWMDKYQRTLGVDEKTANAAWLNAVTNAKKHDQDVREYADKLLQNISSTMEDAPVKFSDLNANVQQEILKSSNEATEAEQEANRFKALADQYESESIEGYGVFTDFNEWMKQSLGLEDTTSLRRMQIQIAGSMAALEALSGKGPVSDFELRTFMKGVPKKGASKELVVAYLNGRSKAAQLVSSMANSKQLFLAQNSGSPVAERNFLIYGIPVEQGDTLADFQRNYGNALLEQMFPGDQPEMSYAE